MPRSVASRKLCQDDDGDGGEYETGDLGAGEFLPEEKHVHDRDEEELAAVNDREGNGSRKCLHGQHGRDVQKRIAESREKRGQKELAAVSEKLYGDGFTADLYIIYKVENRHSGRNDKVIEEKSVDLV